jgi:2,4-dienoyl-CoA reductase-like NADH-dependent reductase (Old Yellow Enzyme family)
MADLFDTTSINSMTLKNRFVRSGTHSFMGGDDSGAVTQKETDLMRNLAKGGVGLLVTGYAYVVKDGHCAPRQLGIHNDAMVPGLIQMVNAIHEAGGKVVVQIVHGGAYGIKEYTGVEPMGPSAIPPTQGKRTPFPGCRAMTQDDIDSVVEGFRQASIRARKAGFDGIQLHGAHGYLFSQFLSPFYNKRTDEYGGNIENRTPIVIDAYEQVRKEVGDDYPVMIKMNVTDFIDGGMSTDDAVQGRAQLQHGSSPRSTRFWSILLGLLCAVLGELAHSSASIRLSTFSIELDHGRHRIG